MPRKRRLPDVVTLKMPVLVQPRDIFEVVFESEEARKMAEEIVEYIKKNGRMGWDEYKDLVFITSTLEWVKGGPKWVVVGRLNRALIGLESLRKGERRAFICTLMRKWSVVLEERALTSRSSQTSFLKSIWRR